MSENMEDALLSIGKLVCCIIFLVIIGLLLEVEYVLPSTFKKGIVKVDSETTYKCELTEESKKIKELKNKIKEIRNKK